MAEVLFQGIAVEQSLERERMPARVSARRQRDKGGFRRELELIRHSNGLLLRYLVARVVEVQVSGAQGLPTVGAIDCPHWGLGRGVAEERNAWVFDGDRLLCTSTIANHLCGLSERVTGYAWQKPFRSRGSKTRGGGGSAKSRRSMCRVKSAVREVAAPMSVYQGTAGAGFPSVAIV
jgi:hypothetical protein